MEHLPRYHCFRGIAYSDNAGAEYCRACYLDAGSPADLKIRIIHLCDTYPSRNLDPCDRCDGALALMIRPAIKCYECLFDVRGHLGIEWCEFESLVEYLELKT